MKKKERKNTENHTKTFIINAVYTITGAFVDDGEVDDNHYDHRDIDDESGQIRKFKLKDGRIE